MFQGTTILSVRHDGQVAMGCDGQVSMGNTIVKQKASKIRKLSDGKVLAGFAGASADAFALFERFEGKLEEFRGNLPRAAVELTKLWRTDKYLRRLEALLAVADKDHSLLVSGTGEIVEPEDGLLAIGSGGNYALSAARALISHSSLNAEQIVRESIQIASTICVYTNDQIEVQTL
jgi:ATP-dependent HslUV protease subunit HslV